MFHNNWGTAPGCAFEKDGKIVIMIPGPPKECNPMFEHCALPYLKKLSDEQIVSHSVRIFGIGESRVDDIFSEEMNAMQNPTMAPYAKECDCLLQITAKAESEEKAEEMIKPVMEHVCERLGEYVYGIDVECVEERVIQLLREKNMRFAAAESCTGGEVSKRFTDIPGASAFFLGGAVTYTNQAKARILGIDPALIEREGAVSRTGGQGHGREDPGNLRRGHRPRRHRPCPGPDGDGVHEVGTVFVSMAVEGETFVRALKLGRFRTRSFIRRMAGNHAYDMMRRYLTGLPVV